MNPLRLDPQGPFMRGPLAPHHMRDRLTRTQDVFVQCHLGVPRLERDRWSLTIDGMVERPCTLRFDDLVRHPKTEVASVHQCCGSPLAPFAPSLTNAPRDDRAVGRAGHRGLGLGRWRHSPRLRPHRRRGNMTTRRARAVARTRVAALFYALDTETARRSSAGFIGRGHWWMAPTDIG
jgi:hypothetical protein